MTKTLQFGPKSVIIGGIDANLLASFLTNLRKTNTIDFKPTRAKAADEIGVSVVVKPRGLFICKTGDAKCYTELSPRFTPSFYPAPIAADVWMTTASITLATAAGTG